MKAKINNIKATGAKEGKHGTLYGYEIKYEVDGIERIGYYNSKSEDQKKFIEGQECEFTEEKRTSGKGNDYYIIKPVYQGRGKSNFGKALSREQSKYSGFAMSYAKDLVIADKIKMNEIEAYTRKMFDLMVELDKTLQS